jgi:UPF0755 protein
LASIIEKETGRADERSRVAAVFANRLRQKIKLQSIRPSFMAWSVAGHAGTADQALGDHPAFAVQHLCDRGPAAGTDRQSGRASEAAANPARTRDLFFVADGTGGRTFTETYDAHQKNVAKLRAMEKQIQNDTVEPAADDAPPAAAGAAPADANPPRPQGRVRRSPPPGRRRPAAPAQAPARQGAAVDHNAPVVQR